MDGDFEFWQLALGIVLLLLFGTAFLCWAGRQEKKRQAQLRSFCQQRGLAFQAGPCEELLTDLKERLKLFHRGGNQRIENIIQSQETDRTWRYFELWYSTPSDDIRLPAFYFCVPKLSLDTCVIEKRGFFEWSGRVSTGYSEVEVSRLDGPFSKRFRCYLPEGVHLVPSFLTADVTRVLMQHRVLCIETNEHACVIYHCRESTSAVEGPEFIRKALDVAVAIAPSLQNFARRLD